MSQFRKKPDYSIIDAVKVSDVLKAADDGTARAAWPTWLLEAYEAFVIGLKTDAVLIHDAELTERAESADWIVRSGDGELRPCKPDIFAATYEPAEPIQRISDADGPTYHIRIRCDEGETPSVLALSVIAKHAMILVGAPRASPLMPGAAAVPRIRSGFSLHGTDTIKQTIAILQESLRKIEQAGGERG